MTALSPTFRGKTDGGVAAMKSPKCCDLSSSSFFLNDEEFEECQDAVKRPLNVYDALNMEAFPSEVLLLVQLIDSHKHIQCHKSIISFISL
jgi:hypothetical protein